MYLGIARCDAPYERVDLSTKDEFAAWMFGISIVRAVKARSATWSIVLYREDGTPIERWHRA